MPTACRRPDADRLPAVVHLLGGLKFPSTPGPQTIRGRCGCGRCTEGGRGAPCRPGPRARPGGSFQPASGGGSCHCPSYRSRYIPTFHTLHLAHVKPSTSRASVCGPPCSINSSLRQHGEQQEARCPSAPPSPPLLLQVRQAACTAVCATPQQVRHRPGCCLIKLSKTQGKTHTPPQLAQHDLKHEVLQGRAGWAPLLALGSQPQSLEHGVQNGWVSRDVPALGKLVGSPPALNVIRAGCRCRCRCGSGRGRGCNIQHPLASHALLAGASVAPGIHAQLDGHPEPQRCCMTAVVACAPSG